MPWKRAQAEVFDREAERYDRTRPGYPAALIDEVLGPSPQAVSVVDIACGTGIASRMMTARGAQVLGVDLNPGMARIAERHGIRTEVASFETWDPAGRTFDIVTCAQAWHWLDPQVSLEKAVALLRPGGRLCLFWSVGQHPDDLADALHAAYRRMVPPDAPSPLVGYAANRANSVAVDFRAIAGSLAACDQLSQPGVKSFPWSRTYTRDRWLDELQSHSDHAALPPRVLQDLLGEIGRTIDRFGGSFRMPYVTTLICAARR